MRDGNRVNVLFAATASAVLHGALSVAFVPFFSTVLAFLALPGHPASVETGMALALITPLAYAGAGFISGGLMACGYNTFCWALVPRVRREVVVREELVARAAVGDAA